MNQALERLGLTFIERHPDLAASTLERLDPADVREFLAASPPETAAVILMRVSPSIGRSYVQGVASGRLGEIVARMSVASGADVLRQLSADDRFIAMKSIQGEKLRALTRVLEFPPETVGAVMDPAYPAFSADLDCGGMIKELKKSSLRGITCVYALDRAQNPIGVVRTHDLFLSEPTESVTKVLNSCNYRIHGKTDWHTVTGNPDLRLWNALPVIDDENRYIGALREETMIGLAGDSMDRRELQGVRRTSLALGEVFRLGLSGILDTIDDTMK